MKFALKKLHVAASAATLFLVASCTTAPAENPAPKETGLGQPLPSSLREALTPGYIYQDRSTCPFFTDKQAKNLFKNPALLNHSAKRNTTGPQVTCTSQADSADSQPSPLSLLVKQSEQSGSRNIQRVREWYSQQGSPKVVHLPDLTAKHPGFGFTTTDTGFYWACGPFTISLSTQEPESLLQKGQDPQVALQAVFTSRIHELCGTTTKPTTEVVSHAHETWAIFDAYGGTSPTEYKVQRPDSMQPGKPILARKSTGCPGQVF